MKNIIRRLCKELGKASIRIKLLVIFIATIIIPMLGINYISYINSTKLVRNEIQNSLYGLTVQINSNLEDWLNKMDSLTSLLYSNELFNRILNNSKYNENSYDMLNDNREFDKLFVYMLSQSTEIDSIYVFTSNGNVFYKSYSGSMKLDYNPENEEWYRDALKNEGKITLYGVHPPWPLSNSNSRVLSLAREIRSFDRQNLGVVLIDIKLDSISQLIKKTDTSYDSKILIIDGNNNTIYHDDSYDVKNEQNKSALDSLFKSENNSVNATVDNEKVFLTYKISSYTGWKIVSITPERSIGSITGQLLKLNVLMTLIALVVFSSLVILLYTTIYKPILRLTFLMKIVESGNFNIKIDVPSGDEIGRLCMNFNNMVYKINSLIESEYKAVILRKDAEFKALQAQINPHFLYNTLQLISSIAVVKKVPEIIKTSKSLGYMLRYSIKTKGDIVPFWQELEHVTSYTAIQKIRMEDKVSIIITVDDSVFEFGIMKLVIQPFVENAFIHGIEKKKDGGVIELSVKPYGEYMIIKVKDNGIGMDKEKLESLRLLLEKGAEQPVFSNKMNIGICNVNSRLKLFYGTEYTIDIESSMGFGTEITLKIPAIKYLEG